MMKWRMLMILLFWGTALVMPKNASAQEPCATVRFQVMDMTPRWSWSYPIFCRIIIVYIPVRGIPIPVPVPCFGNGRTGTSPCNSRFVDLCCAPGTILTWWAQCRSETTYFRDCTPCGGSQTSTTQLGNRIWFQTGTCSPCIGMCE